MVALLSAQAARFRVVEHVHEGRSELISKIRGNDPGQAMKALVCEIKGGGLGTRHVLAVVPGVARLDMKALARHVGQQKGRFAPPETATALTGCVMGAVPPFSFDRSALALVVDEGFRAWDEVVFNAGRLDRSLFVHFDDYVNAARPD
ncbi:MAG: YbaK/prolyl-tRNA synthetase associated domain-containing protein, partial [Rhodospirillales bacterium]|nr:YbaK/prolyl-tRNA synthetase associated domain-containing protein [Rhodospirillales bacterium]